MKKILPLFGEYLLYIVEFYNTNKGLTSKAPTIAVLPNGIPRILYPKVMKLPPSIQHTRQLNITQIHSYGSGFTLVIHLSY
jgi:hypothetical protein